MQDETPHELAIHDSAAFNSEIYTSFEDAMVELERRRSDPELVQKAKEYIGGLPTPMEDGIPRGVLFRQVATPNYEIRRFIQLADGGGLKPLILEYHQDKFVSSNEFKYFLLRLAFYCGEGKKGGKKILYKMIADFNTAGGKRLCDVECAGGKSLIDVHHALFSDAYEGASDSMLFDASDWFHSHGPSASEYYKRFLALFITHGIIYENFMLNDDEKWFTENVFYPAFKEVHEYFGLKPLIVALEPTDIEGEEFWMCHPPALYDTIEKYL